MLATLSRCCTRRPEGPAALSFGKACRTARMLKSGSRVRGVVGSWNYWGGTAGLQQLPWGLYATGLKDSACFPHHARPTQ